MYGQAIPPLFDAHLVLREIFGVLPKPPFTPIQEFGLPFDEYRPDRPDHPK